MEDLKVALQDYTLLQRKLKQSICLELWKKVWLLWACWILIKYINISIIFYVCSKSKTSF